jgi:sugar/nucleoside kinase (ribokinase family)
VSSPDPDTSRRVVVVGDLMVDVVARLSGPLAHRSDTPARIERHGGGSAANVAAWLAAAGVPVTFAGRAGDDAAGHEAITELEASGVQARVALDPRRPTGTCLVLVEPGGERTMVPGAGANDGLEPTDLPEGEHLHLAGYTLLREGSRAAGLHALAQARERGMTISLDPSSAAPLAAAGAAAFLAWAGRLDLIVPNVDEALVLSSELEAEPAAMDLAAAATEVVVTLGAGGAIWSDGATVRRHAAHDVAVVDTTGAGDAFVAGLLSAWRPGADPTAALEAACALAARAVGQPGARPR